VFPVRDDNPTLRTSLATLAIIGLNVASWIVLQGLGSEHALIDSVCNYGLIPAELLERVPPGTRVELGPGATCVVGGPSWFTAITSMFMHGGWFHIIGNLWFLWIFGNNVEDVMGHLRFGVFYLLCGLAAAAAQTLSAPSSTLPMVGASGAIGGVMGAYFVLYPRAHVWTVIFFGFYLRTIAVPAAVMLGYWFLLQLLGGLPTLGSEGGGVAFWAHAGGFLAGVLLVYVFRDPRLVAAHRAMIERRGPGQ
jgi:membrane associated rhomboid family serine protease